MLVSELLFGKSNIPVSAEMIRMTEVRHKELVNNIANIDTPYYKAKDINVGEFQNLLAEAIEKRHQNHPCHFLMNSGRDVKSKASYAHFHMKSISELSNISTQFSKTKRKDDTIMRHDQNNVTIEGEMARLGKNASLHRTFVTLARDNFSAIETALRMRV